MVFKKELKLTHTDDGMFCDVSNLSNEQVTFIRQSLDRWEKSYIGKDGEFDPDIIALKDAFASTMLSMDKAVAAGQKKLTREEVLNGKTV